MSNAIPRKGGTKHNSSDHLSSCSSTAGSSRKKLNSRSGSPSSSTTTSADIDAGFGKTNSQLRSILIDPIIGIPIAAFLNDTVPVVKKSTATTPSPPLSSSLNNNDNVVVVVKTSKEILLQPDECSNERNDVSSSPLQPQPSSSSSSSTTITTTESSLLWNKNVVYKNLLEQLLQNLPDKYKELFFQIPAPLVPENHTSTDSIGSCINTSSSGQCCRDHIKAMSVIFMQVASSWEKDEKVLTNALAQKLPITRFIENNDKVVDKVVELQRRKESTGIITIDLENEKKLENSQHEGRVDFVFSKKPSCKTTDHTETIAFADDKDCGNEDFNISSEKETNEKTTPVSQTDTTPKRSVVALVEFGVNSYTYSKKLRLALLYRKQTTTLLEASREFGKVFLAAEICAMLRDNNQDAYDKFEYLGPHCCMFGDKIFRSYDTRLRATDRRPDIYLSKKIFTGVDETTPILEIYDQTNNTQLLQFGNSNDDMNDDTAPETKREWIWKFCGKLLIIATPYRVGRHYATQPTQFIPIIKHLITLHKNGFVHGDIRAYNMILQDKDNGWLIDFDYGGRVKDKVKYPRGYKDTLFDGRRLGQYPNVITKDDDWYALFEVMTYIHNYKLPDDVNNFIQFNKIIESIREKIVAYETAIEEIKLLPVKTYGPFGNFVNDLVKNGFIPKNQNLGVDKQLPLIALRNSN